jgi:hypothetical protein
MCRRTSDSLHPGSEHIRQPGLRFFVSTDDLEITSTVMITGKDEIARGVRLVMPFANAQTRSSFGESPCKGRPGKS